MFTVPCLEWLSGAFVVYYFAVLLRKSANVCIPQKNIVSLHTFRDTFGGLLPSDNPNFLAKWIQTNTTQLI